jgi:hypothetical protein
MDALLEDAKATPIPVMARYDRDCQQPSPQKLPYDWRKAPDGMVFCAITPQKMIFWSL